MSFRNDHFHSSPVQDYSPAVERIQARQAGEFATPCFNPDVETIDPTLVAYERWLEWEVGGAKYVEVDCLRLAFQTTTQDHQTATGVLAISLLPERKDRSRT